MSPKYQNLSIKRGRTSLGSKVPERWDQLHRKMKGLQLATLEMIIETLFSCLGLFLGILSGKSQVEVNNRFLIILYIFLIFFLYKLKVKSFYLKKFEGNRELEKVEKMEKVPIFHAL